MYFLVSIDFDSQRTSKSTFAVSNLRIASRTHGAFSSFFKNAAPDIASIVSIKRESIRFPSEYFCVLGISSW